MRTTKETITACAGLTQIEAYASSRLMKIDAAMDPTRLPMNVATIAREGVPQTGRTARLAARAGGFTGQTASVAPGYVQGNLAILPEDLAGHFLRFCHLNPKPCPLLAASAPGDFRLPTLADDLDIRTDLPRYRVFRRGELVDEPADIRAHWRDDLVAFVLGCSFSFEEALVEGGIELRHITCNATVPMYRTSIATAPAGPFHALVRNQFRRSDLGHSEFTFEKSPSLPGAALRANVEDLDERAANRQRSRVHDGARSRQ